MPFLGYLEFGSSDFDETLRKCSWYEKNDWLWGFEIFIEKMMGSEICIDKFMGV